MHVKSVGFHTICKSNSSVKWNLNRFLHLSMRNVIFDYSLRTRSRNMAWAEVALCPWAAKAASNPPIHQHLEANHQVPDWCSTLLFTLLYRSNLISLSFIIVWISELTWMFILNLNISCHGVSKNEGHTFTGNLSYLF